MKEWLKSQGKGEGAVADVARHVSQAVTSFNREASEENAKIFDYKNLRVKKI